MHKVGELAMVYEFLSSDWTFGLSSVVALAVVAAIGYLFGRTQTKANQPGEFVPGHTELQRASRIARQLESIADDLRQDLALHSSQVEQFKLQLRHAEGAETQEAWRKLREEAENMVAPTLQLVSQLSTAYDKIRQQSQSLANFTGGRTDPLTGLANSRSLEEHLEVLLQTTSGGGGVSAVVVVSLDGEAIDRDEQQARVQQVGQQLAQGLRGDDFAARYGVDEFVVVLPATGLAGASVFAGRLRKTLGEKLGLSVCCGLAESMPKDSPGSLLSRADSAAYSARAAGPCQQFLHTGAAIRPDTRQTPSVDASSPCEGDAADDQPVEEGAKETVVDCQAETVCEETDSNSSDDEALESSPAPPDPAPPNPAPTTPVTIALAGPPVSGDLMTPTSDPWR